jgi:predicted RND superfamily exporter protein
VTLLSAGDPGVLDPWITLDQSRLRISAETRHLTTPAVERLLVEVENSLRRALPPEWDFSVTGPVALAGALSGDFARSQTVIYTASSVFVCALIGIYLRSLPWALLAMIPNAVALLLLFGVMGHLGIAMEFGAAVVGPIAIGIAADDTIHFLTAYGRARRSGVEWLPALRGAISGVGEAVITTSTALALGFLSMLASPLPAISNLGLLSAIAILAATLADLLVLPALIGAAAVARHRFAEPATQPPKPERSPTTRSDVF